MHSSSTVSLSIARSLLADFLLLPHHRHNLSLALSHLVAEGDGCPREAQLDREGGVEVWMGGGHGGAYPPVVFHHLLLLLCPLLLEQ